MDQSVVLQRILCLIGLIVCSSCVIVSLFVPWVRPNVPVHHGLFRVLLPIDLGLTRCYSDICQKHSDLDNFLKSLRAPTTARSDPPSASPTLSPSRRPVSSAPSAAPTSTQAPTTETSRLQGLVQNGEGEKQSETKIPKLPVNWLPKEVQNGLDDTLTAQEDAVRSSLRAFRTASIATLTVLAVALLLLAFLLLSLLSNALVTLGWLTMSGRSQGVTLVVASFFLFLAGAVYMLLTFLRIDGGAYLDGLWLVLYASLVGLFCGLAVVVLPESSKNGYIRVPDEAEQQQDEHRGWSARGSASGQNVEMVPLTRLFPAAGSRSLSADPIASLS
eukprot:gene9315-10283_t